MSKEELDNLVRINRLKAEPGSRREFADMVNSARTRLADAQNESLDPDSRFDLGWRSLPYATQDTGRKIELRFSTRSYIGFGQVRRPNLSQGSQRTQPCRIRGPYGDRQGSFGDLIRCTKELDTAAGKLDPPAGE